VDALKEFKKRDFTEMTEEAAPGGYRLRVELRKTAGGRDFYFFEPNGKRLRSLPDLKKHMQI
jgi:hypothetical protein